MSFRKIFFIFFIQHRAIAFLLGDCFFPDNSVEVHTCVYHFFANYCHTTASVVLPIFFLLENCSQIPDFFLKNMKSPILIVELFYL
jgi:hypothetical protein